MPETLVRLREVTVAVRGRTLLGPLSFEVQEGAFWGVVGPNGAGKSTLLRVIAGLRTFQGGSVERLGVVQSPDAAPATFRHHIGLLFQQHDYLPDFPLTALDVVLFGRLPEKGLGRQYRQEDLAAAREALSSLGLQDLEQRLYRELSGGERQKTQLARLVAQNCRLMLLDEPTSGLDLLWQERLTQLIASIHRDSRRTVVMVTHEPHHLPACCTHVLLLKEGGVLTAGRVEEVLQAATLRELYECDLQVVAHAGRHHVFPSPGSKGS
jgi:ABC-type cobalamin/Fe3+-siderophores transport system ATPase subunit